MPLLALRSLYEVRAVVVAPGASPAAAGVLGPTVVLGSLGLTLGAPAAAADAVGPTVILGSIVFTPVAALAQANAAGPDVIGGLTESTESPYLIHFRGRRRA